MQENRKSRPLPLQAKQRLTLYYCLWPMLVLEVTKGHSHQYGAAAPRTLPFLQEVPSLSPQTPPNKLPKDWQKNMQEITDGILNNVKATQSFQAITELLKGRQGWDTSAPAQVQCHPGPPWGLPYHQTWSWDILGAQLETLWYFQCSWAPTGMLTTEKSFKPGTTKQPWSANTPEKQ